MLLIVALNGFFIVAWAIYVSRYHVKGMDKLVDHEWPVDSVFFASQRSFQFGMVCVSTWAARRIYPGVDFEQVPVKDKRPFVILFNGVLCCGFFILMLGVMKQLDGMGITSFYTVVK